MPDYFKNHELKQNEIINFKDGPELNIETYSGSFKKGAYDFIEKPFKENDLCTLVDRMLSKARIDYSQASQRKITQSLLSKLTGRERQVLERIVAGRLNKQIADDLGISIKTVEAHRANIMEKLNVNTVADLLRLALSDPQPI